MRNLIVTEFVSLDGVMHAPEQWVFDYHDSDTLRYKTEEITEADALVLGEHTYNIFASSWPTMSGPLADRMNSIHKYVMTRHSNTLTWAHSTPLGEDVVGAVSHLKRTAGRAILVVGSRRLVEILSQNHLIDEYRLFICPIVLAAGARLFSPTPPATMTLVECRRFRTGALLVRYTAQHTTNTSTKFDDTTNRRAA